ncbi:MAG: nickel-binding protein [Chitinophagaceae bacterium]
MPIYMDRHDVSETVTAAHVLEIHQEDLKIQDQYGCRVLTYWFDDIRKNAFCLVEAPDVMAIHKMHSEAHGNIPNSIIEVSTGIVEMFLGRIEDPEHLQNSELSIINESALRTIMIITLKQLTPPPINLSGIKSTPPAYNSEVISQLHLHEGTLVKQLENYFLVSFKSVCNAVHAALKIHLLFKEFNKLNNDPFTYKIGLNSGLPVTEKKLLFEDTIKFAERMCKVVKGQVILSAEVKELFNNENSKALAEGENIFSLTQTDEKFLTFLMDYTEATWNNENLKIDDFSKPLGCSKSQLYRKMISLTGKSPNNFILEYRLNEALLLLSKKAGNIAEIAYKTGFTSPSYFSKCFKKKYGFLPSDYQVVKVA